MHSPESSTRAGIFASGLATVISGLAGMLVSTVMTWALSFSPFMASVNFTFRPYGEKGCDSSFIMASASEENSATILAAAGWCRAQPAQATKKRGLLDRAPQGN